MRIAALALAAATAALATGSARAASFDDVFGLWLVESKSAIVQIDPCGDKACGKIVWLAEPNREDGSPKLDRMNPDESRRNAPICGLPMIGGFTRGGDSWDDGYIYDAKEGDIYTATMNAQDDGTLSVRGYVGISLFGKSQTWTKAADNKGGC